MKRLFALALTALMLMTFFTGCCCCNIGISDDMLEQFGGISQDATKNENAEQTNPVGELRPVNGLNLLEPGKLIVATNAAFPPYEYFDDNGNIVGIDIDIARAVADRLDLQLVILETEFTDALQAVQENKADIIISGITMTENRRDIMDFSDVYTTNTQVVVISRRSKIKTMDEMWGKEIGTMKNTTGFIYCSDEYGNDNVVQYDDADEIFMDLAKGRVDCVVIDRVVAEAYVMINSELSILGEYCVEDYRIGLPKGNDALKEAVNEALAELIADGTVQSIINRHLFD